MLLDSASSTIVSALAKLSLVGLLLSSHWSAASEIKVAFVTNREPYCFKINDVDSGIEVDLIRAALAPFGHSIKPLIVPKARLALILKAGEVDISATLQGKDGDGLYFSDPYIQFQNYAISKKKAGIELSTLSDVDKYSFIIWQGGWKNLGPAFEASYKPDSNGRFRANYNESHSQLNQSKMFWFDRAQLIIVDKKIFEHFRKQLRNDYKTDEEVVFHDVMKVETSYPAAFRNKELRDQFNAGLKKIRADGSYQAIIDAYR
ncbi:substrate-binding periplasmic protein [Undibacterium sp. Ren11W]|uniref:substrate-binding periplasmic protein n=1 Tax=Undibacterium sp. Ren11W TaxID=3413045 RepID=UPI003BF1DF74